MASPQDERSERLAQALRDNLRRRKAQSRATNQRDVAPEQEDDKQDKAKPPAA